MKNILFSFAFVILCLNLLAQTIQHSSNLFNSVKANSISNPDINETKTIIDTLHYDGNFANGIGTGSAGTYEVYAFFPASQLTPYNTAGNTITSIDIYINDASKVTSTTIKFRPSQSSTSYSQPFVPVSGWNNIILSTPFSIPAANLYIGYECVCINGAYPMGADAGPVNPNGNWIYYSGTWAHLTDLNSLMTYNWNIRARVDGTIISSDATLSSLSVNGSSVPAFSPTTLTYNMVLPYGTTTMPVVTATTNHNLATKVITNVTSLPGTATVVVTAQDGTTILTYSINFTVASPSTNATLSDLKVNGTTVASFNPSVFSYTITFPYGTTTLPIITATTADINATKIITNAGTLPGTGTVAVTAQDGITTNSYTVNFSLAPANTDASLSDLLVNGTTITGFNSTVYDYYIELPYGSVIVPSVTATTNFINATTQITNASSLPGTTTILVTAEDGTTSHTYNIHFTIAAANTDATLVDLQISGITVQGFSSSIYTYNVELPYGTTIVPTVNAVPTYINATTQITNAPSLPGTTLIVVTAEDGTTTITYYINFTIATGISDINDNKFLVYPNPSYGEIKISCDDLFEIYISDISNRIIYLNNNLHNTFQINLKEFGSGTYFIQLKTSEKVGFYKITII